MLIDWVRCLAHVLWKTHKYTTTKFWSRLDGVTLICLVFCLHYYNYYVQPASRRRAWSAGQPLNETRGKRTTNKHLEKKSGEGKVDVMERWSSARLLRIAYNSSWLRRASVTLPETGGGGGEDRNYFSLGNRPVILDRRMRFNSAPVRSPTGLCSLNIRFWVMDWDELRGVERTVGRG